MAGGQLLWQLDTPLLDVDKQLFGCLLEVVRVYLFQRLYLLILLLFWQTHEPIAQFYEVDESLLCIHAVLEGEVKLIDRWLLKREAEALVVLH